MKGWIRFLQPDNYEGVENQAFPFGNIQKEYSKYSK